MTSDSVDLQSIYPWITKELFQDIIIKEYPNKIVQVKDYTVSPAVPHGENFGSQMIRVIVKYLLDNNTKEFRFVIKALHYNSEVKRISTEMDVFRREIYNYKFVIPAVHKLLEEIGDDTKVAAKCFAACAEKKYIIFEDLLARDYKLVEKKNGLDVEHYKRTLEKIAKWHAATLVIQDNIYSVAEILPLMKEFQTHCMNNTTVWEDMAHNAIDTSVRFLKSKPGYEKLAEKVSKIRNNLFSKVLSSIQCDDHTFLTLCHGDLWCSNLLFAYDTETNRPSDALLLDFQISYWGPAIIDVINTLFSSSHEDLREKDWDHLLQFYQQQLIETFKKLNYSKTLPTLTEIQAQFILKGFSNVAIALIATGARKFEAHRMKDFTEIAGHDSGAELRYRMMSNPNAWKQYEFIFDYFERKGYFD